MKILHKISLILTIPMLLSGCLLNRLNTYELIGIADAVSHIAKNTVNAVDNLIGDTSSSSEESSESSSESYANETEASSDDDEITYYDQPVTQKANLTQLKATFDNLIASKGKSSNHQEVYLNYNLDTDDKVYTKIFDLCRLGQHLYGTGSNRASDDINKRIMKAKTASKVVKALEPEALYAILNNYLEFNSSPSEELAFLNLYSSKPIPFLINVDSKNRIFFAKNYNYVSTHNNKAIYKIQIKLLQNSFSSYSKYLGSQYFDQSKNNCIFSEYLLVEDNFENFQNTY